MVNMLAESPCTYFYGHASYNLNQNCKQYIYIIFILVVSHEGQSVFLFFIFDVIVVEKIITNLLVPIRNYIVFVYSKSKLLSSINNDVCNTNI